MNGPARSSSAQGRTRGGGDPVGTAVAAFLARYAPTGPVLVGVSGGADSFALALALQHSAGDRTVAVTVDHGLQTGSAERAQHTADVLRHRGFERVEVRTVEVGTAGGPEGAARRARSAALCEAASALGAGTPILLAHTMDDQAETVLLGLGRGSGPRSIAGMRTWRAPFGRPLLGVRRSDTEACCRAAGLDFWSDPHNADPRFTRVRLRREVLPLLEQVLGGGVVAALARTAALVDDDLQVLDEQAATLHAALCTPAPVVAALAAVPVALRRRVLRIWLQDNGIGELTAEHYARIDDVLVRRSVPGAQVRLPGGVDLTVVGGVLQAAPVQR